MYLQEKEHPWRFASHVGNQRNITREDVEYNVLDMVVQNLPCSDLLHCLKTYWDILKGGGDICTAITSGILMDFAK